MAGNKNRIVSFIVVLLFSLVIFGSGLFIIFHADHNCTGEDCPVCTEIAECYGALHTIGTANADVSLLVPAFVSALILARVIIKTHSEHTTLISLKVELLN